MYGTSVRSRIFSVGRLSLGSDWKFSILSTTIGDIDANMSRCVNGPRSRKITVPALFPSCRSIVKGVAFQVCACASAIESPVPMHFAFGNQIPATPTNQQFELPAFYTLKIVLSSTSFWPGREAEVSRLPTERPPKAPEILGNSAL